MYMTKDQKINAIMNNIALNYSQFQQQAREKLKKQRKIVNPSTDYRELVCDVVFSVIKNLNSTENINRFYIMCTHDKLKLYIFKAIDTNTRFNSSPFLRKKLKEFNRFTFLEDVEYSTNISFNNTSLSPKKGKRLNRFILLKDVDSVSTYDEEQLEDEKNKDKEQEFLYSYIMSLVEPPTAIKLLGEDWRYYSTLFKEYFSDVNTTYMSLEEKYGFPSSTLYRDVTYVKNKIKDHLEKNNIYQKLK